MKIEVGEYVRTKNGHIGKVIDISRVTGQSRKKYLIKWNTSKAYYITNITIIKNSKRIIDLIEVGDYVNGQQITKVTYDPFVDNQTDLWTDRTIPFGQDFQKERFLNKDIKTVLTHEQFEQNAYRLEEK